MKNFFYTLLLVFLSISPVVLADSAEFEEGKYYKIKWNRGSQLLMTENEENHLYAATASTNLMQYWQFIPTGNADCYYIRNAVSQNYIQSCNMTDSPSSLATTGTEPVEYYVGMNPTLNAYRFTSTDCDNYLDTSASPHGLNKDGASSNIIVWKAGDSNGGSYWLMDETAFDYSVEVIPVEHSDFARKAGIYYMACGKVTATKIAKVKVTGEGAMKELEYPTYVLQGGRSSRQNANTTLWTLYTTDKAEVARGHEIEIDVTLTADPPTGFDLYAYFDWNGDGEFDQCVSQKELTSKTIVLNTKVPEDAVMKETRMRLRLTENGEEGADQDVIGQVFDGFVTACDFAEPSLTLLVNDTLRGSVSYVEGEEPNTYVVTATPCGDAQFICWMSGRKLLSTMKEKTFTVARPTVITAYFMPNTTDERPTAIEDVLTDPLFKAQNSGIYDLNGRKTTPKQSKGFYIKNGKKILNHEK